MYYLLLTVPVFSKIILGTSQNILCTLFVPRHVSYVHTLSQNFTTNNKLLTDFLLKVNIKHKSKDISNIWPGVSLKRLIAKLVLLTTFVNIKTG